MTSRLLRPSAVVLAAITAVKTDYVKLKSTKTISELPIYATEETKCLEYTIPKRTELEEQIGRIRRKVWSIADDVEERLATIKERYRAVRDKLIEYSNIVTQTADTEENVIPKVAMVSLVGVIGFTAAGSSRVRQIIFPLVGSTAMAAVCFPTITNRVLVKPGIQVYHQLEERMIQLKNKAMEKVNRPETRHIEKAEDREITENDRHEEGENVKATEVEDGSVVEEQRDVLLSVSERESSETVQRIEGDFGQSDPSDSDMYTNHSTK